MLKIGILFITLLVLVNGDKENQILLLDIENISTTKGKIWFGIYDSEQSFLNEEKATAIFGESVTKTGSVQLKLDKIPFGTYAIAVFHDLNSNGRLDQSMIGIPQEPYAFSNKPKSKWRAPVFEEVKFSFKHANQQLKMRLENW